MLSVEEALQLVADHAEPLPAAACATAGAVGLVLAENIVSDIDSPPFDKSIVDGYAVRGDDLRDGAAELTILEEVTAGLTPRETVGPGTATRLMTGAEIPPGADAVVMIERATVAAAAGGGLGRVALRDPGFRAGQHILRRGAAMRQGEVVLDAGAVLRPIELGLLAEVGRTSVRAIPRPSVAIVATGNELVAPEDKPGPAQIRNSNGPMLAGAVTRAGGEPRMLGIARDDRGSLTAAIRAGLAADVLLLTGGVSAGVLDLVPEVLAAEGVEKVLHHVRLKPGKPLWFGVRRAADRRTLVFGLPGNPVSTLVCFELFARPALARMAGRNFAGLRQRPLRLACDHAHRGDRPTYHPSRIVAQGGELVVEPLKWRGSGDLRTLGRANALALFPAGERAWRQGESVEVLDLE